MPKIYCGSPNCTGDENCPEVAYCCCGIKCDEHGMGDGHSPVSMHYYYCREDIPPPNEEHPNGKSTSTTDDRSSGG
jgi:hypothetical protein